LAGREERKKETTEEESWEERIRKEVRRWTRERE